MNRALYWTASLLLGSVFSLPASADKTTSDVTRATLQNGLQVVIVKNKLAPVVTTQMNYNVGSNETDNGFPGTAHAVEHMMFRGSPELNKDQLSALAANMGGNFNAETREGLTRYYFTVPKQDLNIALRIHAIRMKQIDMDAKEWQDERKAIEQEVSRDLSSPFFKALTQLRKQLFAGTPYQHTALGTRPSFEKTTAQRLRTFYEQWYVPNNATLVIAGDVDPNATLKEVKQLFTDIPKKPLPERPQFHFDKVKPKHIALPTDASYGIEAFGLRLPGLVADNQAVAAVLVDALGSRRGALFGMGMDGTALGGGFASDMLTHSGLGLAYGVFARGSTAAPIKKRIVAILKAAREQGIDPDLVAAAKRKVIASIAFDNNSVSGLASTWSDALLEQQLHSPADLREAIAKVTPAQVNALAKQVLRPEQLVEITLTPNASGKHVASSGFGGAESFADAPDKPVALPKWAQASFAKLTLPQSSLAPQDFTLDNGLRVIVQPENVSDTVTLTGQVKMSADLQEPKGKEGITSVLDSLFPFGPQGMGRLQLQQAFDDIAANVNAGLSFDLQVPAAHFAEGVKLLAANELKPALSKQAFEIVKHQHQQSIAGALQSPDFIHSLQMKKALLPKQDPALRHATPESIGTLKLADVKQFYKQVMRPDMTTIVIVGNIEPAQAKKIMEQYFGDWHAKGEQPTTELPAVPLNKAHQFNTPKSTSVQDQVTMSQMIAIDQDSPERFAINLGNEVLGGGFYASRLVKDLREKHGLVYSVYSGLSLSAHRGSYEVEFGCDPDKVAEAQQLVLHNLRKMQQEPVSKDELKQAKGLLLRQMPLSESSFSAIGSVLLQLAVKGHALDARQHAAQQYYQLTAKDVQQAYAKFIRPDAFVTGVKGPAPK